MITSAFLLPKSLAEALAFTLSVYGVRDVFFWRRTPWNWSATVLAPRNERLAASLESQGCRLWRDH